MARLVNASSGDVNVLLDEKTNLPNAIVVGNNPQRSVPIGDLSSPSSNQDYAIVIGNSISTAMKASGAANSYMAENMIANALAGNPWKWPELAATTRMDKYGIYGYSGRLIADITADMEAQVFTPLKNAGVVPKYILGLALLENNVGTDNTPYATLVRHVNQWVAACRARFPTAIIIIGTCRPSFSIDSDSKRALFRNINNYLLSIDNSKDLLVYQPGLDYSSSTSPANPIKTVVRGTIASGVLTVNRWVSGLPIEIGQIGESLTGDAYYVSAMTTGYGAEGTYALTLFSGGSISNISAESDIYLYPYTDNSVHPKDRGTFLNAIRLANCVGRLANSFYRTTKRVETNYGLLGTNGTVTGGNASGSAPTGATVTGNTNATCVALALEPGLSLTFSNILDSSGSVPLLSSVVPMDVTLPYGVDAVRASYRIKVVSGGEYLRSIIPRYRVTDNGVLGAATDFLTVASSTYNAHFVDGTEYTFTSNVIRSGGVGTLITRVVGNLVLFAVARCPAGAVIVLELTDACYELPDGNGSLLTLNGATEVVVAAGTEVTANSVVRFAMLTPGGTPAGAPFVSSKTIGTSFGVKGAAGDTSVYRWKLETPGSN